jgi:hypothetical protein
MIVAGTVLAGGAAAGIPKIFRGDHAAKDAAHDEPSAAPHESPLASRPASSHEAQSIAIVDGRESTDHLASRPVAESRLADPALPPALRQADEAMAAGEFATARKACLAFLAIPGDFGADTERWLGVAHARLALALAAESRIEFGADQGLPEPPLSFPERGR